MRYLSRIYFEGDSTSGDEIDVTKLMNFSLI